MTWVCFSFNDVRSFAYLSGKINLNAHLKTLSDIFQTERFFSYFNSCKPLAGEKWIHKQCNVPICLSHEAKLQLHDDNICNGHQKLRSKHY